MSQGHESADLVHLSAESAYDLNAVTIACDVTVQTNRNDVSEWRVNFERADQHDVVHRADECFEVVSRQPSCSVTITPVSPSRLASSTISSGVSPLSGLP